MEPQQSQENEMDVGGSSTNDIITTLNLDKMPEEHKNIVSREADALNQENGKSVDILGGGDCVNFKVSDVLDDPKATTSCVTNEVEMQGDTNRDLGLEIIYSEASSNAIPGQDSVLNGKNSNADADVCVELNHVLLTDDTEVTEEKPNDRNVYSLSALLPYTVEETASTENTGLQKCPDKDTVAENLKVEEKELKSPTESDEKTVTKDVDNASEVVGENPTDEVPANDNQKIRSRSYPFKVLVSGLPVNARMDDITTYFSQFGEVLRVYNEGRHKANVSFANEESVKKAVFCPDPYFDDHKLLIRSVNEVTAVISGIPRSLIVKEAEKAVRSVFQEAEVPVCRVSVPMSELEDSEERKLQGHAIVVFSDPQMLQRAEDKQEQVPFVIGETQVSFFPSINQFYKKFCVRVFPLPSEQPRVVVYESVLSALSDCGEIVALVCQYVPAASAYAGTVLYSSEESVKKALEKEDLKVLEQFVEVQEFHPFEAGQGFCHLWLKVLNLPPRVTVTEVKHHFRHDKGILLVELDLDFGSCFVQVDSEQTIQRCLTMHQTYLRGKCISVLIAEDNPGRSSNYYRGGGGRQGRNRQNYGNNRNKKNMGGSSRGGGGYSGMTFSSGQNSGNQERRGYERKERKYSKSRNNNSEPSREDRAPAQDGGGHGKVAENTAA